MDKLSMDWKAALYVCLNLMLVLTVKIIYSQVITNRQPTIVSVAASTYKLYLLYFNIYQMVNNNKLSFHFKTCEGIIISSKLKKELVYTNVNFLEKVAWELLHNINF